MCKVQSVHFLLRIALSSLPIENSAIQEWSIIIIIINRTSIRASYSTGLIEAPLVDGTSVDLRFPLHLSVSGVLLGKHLWRPLPLVERVLHGSLHKPSCTVDEHDNGDTHIAHHTCMHTHKTHSDSDTHKPHTKHSDSDTHTV